MKDRQLIHDTALAIHDQFGLESIPAELMDKEEQHEALKKLLSKRIAEMIDHEFAGFVNLLYRIDINEAKVKQALSEQPFSKGVEKVAEMIIQRQLQKIATRKQFSSPNHDLEFDI